MFRRVARRVIDETNGDQRPELLVRLVDEVYLNPTRRSARRPRRRRRPPATPSAPRGIGDARSSPTRRARRRRRQRPERRALLRRPRRPPAAVARRPRAAAAERLAFGWRRRRSPRRPATTPTARRSRCRSPPRSRRGSRRSATPTGTASRCRPPANCALDIDPAPAELDLYARVWDANHAGVADWQGAPRPGRRARRALRRCPRPGRYWIEMTRRQQRPGKRARRSPPTSTSPPPTIRSSPTTASARPRRSRPTAEFAATIYPRADADWYKLWIPEPGLLTVTRDQGAADARRRHARLEPQRPGGARLGGAAAQGRRHAARSRARRARHLSDRDRRRATTTRRRSSRSSLPSHFDPVADDGEPNNAFGEAALVPPTGERRLAIFPRADADWLAIDVDHPGELKLAGDRVRRRTSTSTCGSGPPTSRCFATGSGRRGSAATSTTSPTCRRPAAISSRSPTATTTRRARDLFELALDLHARSPTSTSRTTGRPTRRR